MPKQTQRQETAKNRLPRIAAAVLVLLVCCVPVVMLLALCGVEVVSTRVVCGGESQRVFSLTDDPQAILGKSSFTIGAFDKVDLDSFDPGGDYSTIVIKRHAMSHPTNEVARLMHTSAVTNAVADLASQMRALAKKKTVRVRVICDGKSGLFKLSGTVEDALKAAKITLGALDTVNRPLTAALEDDMVIRVQRVAYREARTKKTIDFKIEEMPTDTLYLGEGKVLREGVPGVRTVYYLEQTVDGEAQGKMKIGSAVTKEPINEVLLVGTLPTTPPFLSCPRRSISPWTWPASPFTIKRSSSARPRPTAAAAAPPPATGYCPGVWRSIRARSPTAQRCTLFPLTDSISTATVKRRTPAASSTRATPWLIFT